MRSLYGILSALLLSGCVASNDWDNPFAMDNKAKNRANGQVPMMLNGFEYIPDSRDRARLIASSKPSEPQNYWRQPHNQYSASYLHKSLADYAEQLAMQLVGQSRGMTNFSRVGVASFVALDSSLQNTSIVGNQLAEYLMIQLQQFGLSVVDYKLADTIAVGPYGDLVFSRDADKLSSKLSLDYVVTGTVIENAKGITVNARIGHIEQKHLTASATIEIPRFVVEQLIPATYVPAD